MEWKKLLKGFKEMDIPPETEVDLIDINFHMYPLANSISYGYNSRGHVAIWLVPPEDEEGPEDEPIDEYIADPDKTVH